MTERTVKVNLKIDDSDARRAAKSTDDAMSKLGESVAKTDRKIKDTFKPGPMASDFAAVMRRQVAELAKTANATIPVSPQTDKLRSQIETRLMEIERNLKLEVPTTPAGRREYELALRAMVDDATRHVKAHVKVGVEETASLGTDLGMTTGKAAAGGMAKGILTGGPMIAAAIGGIALGAAPSIGAGVASILTTAIGLGGVGLGVAAAFQDPRIKAAGTRLVDSLGDNLADIGQQFIRPVAAGISYLELAGNRLSPKVQAMLEPLVPYVGKLATAIDLFLQRMMPGLQEASKNAGPLLDEFANVLPEIGAAVGDFFRILSEDSGRSAGDLKALLRVIADGIRGTARLIAALRGAFHAAVESFAEGLILLAQIGQRAFGWMPGLTAKFVDMESTWRSKLEGYRNGATSATDATKEFSGAIDNSSRASAAAKERTDILTKSLADQVREGRTLAEMWRILNGGMVDSDQAMLDASEQLKTITDGWREHGQVLTGNSDAALKNRLALSEYLEITNRIYDAQIAQGKSTDEAAAATNVYINRLRDTMLQAGYTKAQIDEFILAASKVPGEKSMTMRVEDIEAVERLDQFKSKLDTIRDRDIKIRASYEMGRRPTGSYQYFDENRWGGIYTPAETGLLRDASVYSARNPGRYMIAEPQTGGEAFVPRLGDPARSIPILAQAAGWYGMAVGRPGTGGGETYLGTVVLELDGRSVYQSQLRFKRRTGRQTMGLA